MTKEAFLEILHGLKVFDDDVRRCYISRDEVMHAAQRLFIGMEVDYHYYRSVRHGKIIAIVPNPLDGMKVHIAPQKQKGGFSLNYNAITLHDLIKSIQTLPN